MNIFGLRTRDIIEPGEKLEEKLIETFNFHSYKPKDKEIIIIAETVVATTQNRIIDISKIKNISDKAKEYSEKYNIKAELAEIIIKEANFIYGGIPKMLLTEKEGVLIANSGIDKSNTRGNTIYSLWPQNPFDVARRIRKFIIKKYHLNHFGVIISDSRVQPLRRGVVGVAIGVAGFNPVIDCRGQRDLFGQELHFTTRAIADQLTDAAHIIMGEGDEQTPFVIIEGAPVQFVSYDIDPKEMLMPREQDLFVRILSFDNKI